MKKLILIIILFTISCKQKTTKEYKLPINFDEIRNVLDSIYIEDQKYRLEIDSMNNRFGWQSKEMKDHWNKIRKTDSSNLIKVQKILDTYGWLNANQVGKTANSTLFLVIQHSNQKTQEKYLPMMRKAVKEGKANSKSLALLEDRVSLGKGELQIYGSQIRKDHKTGEMYVRPLIEPEKVNERRKKVGLGSIEEYVSHWNIKWDVDDYKKKLPKWIERLKKESEYMLSKSNK